jgi:methylated-DNA-[protein]-cysteine S-methyltransferase
MTSNDEALISTPFGAVAITEHNGRLAIELLAVPTKGSIQIAKQSSNPVLVNACQQIIDYLQQPITKFDLPATQQGTAFQQRVWNAIMAIPLGQTRTYSEIAQQIGSGPRAVANACGANSLPLVVPCHRVVAKHGIGGFMQGQKNGLLVKQWLLRHEGVNI